MSRIPNPPWSISAVAVLLTAAGCPGGGEQGLESAAIDPIPTSTSSVGPTTSTESSGPAETGSGAGESGEPDPSTGGGGEPEAVVLVDRYCIDGAYVLDPPELFFGDEPRPSLDDLFGSYDPSNVYGFVEQALARRYPTGLRILEMGGGAKALGAWLPEGSSASPEGVLSFLGVVVHETGHGIDEQTPESWYLVSVDEQGNELSFSVPGMHGPLSWSGSPRFSMERSRLLADDQNFKRPPATDLPTSEESGPGDWGSDPMFAQIYLNGDPDDSSFQSGDQGYNMLMEEFVQYTNSLAVRAAFSDVVGGTTSDRHALLTWIWWNQRYLRKIRLERPEEHQYLLENDAWLEFILTTWGRAWLYISAEVSGMQPDTDQLHHLVQEPEMLEEIQILRRAYGCNSSEELLPQYVGL